MRKGLLFGMAALAALVSGVAAGADAVAQEGPTLPKVDWTFSGPFGTFDRHALQRGLQVYREVCSTCHSLKYIAFRDLADLGYSPEEVKAIAAQYTVQDGPNDDGDMFERPGRPSDYFPSPFPNAKAAAAANGGAVPPDLSLIAKALEGGPDRIHAVLTGFQDLVPQSVLQNIFKVETEKRQTAYEEAMVEFKNNMATYNKRIAAGETNAPKPTEPEKPKPVESVADMGLASTAHFNAYFPGYGIAMPQPLYADGVTYADGTKATIDQEAYDVANFLMWAAEPKMEDRKETGIKVLLFLVVFTGVLYAAKRKVWSDVDH